DINHQTINRWLININMILRCLVQNSTEEAKLTQWNDALSSVNLTRDEMFTVALLHILHDVPITGHYIHVYKYTIVWIDYHFP
ncbi:unnamed protein product, partial [Rotaria sp. Silwood2]